MGVTDGQATTVTATFNEDGWDDGFCSEETARAFQTPHVLGRGREFVSYRQADLLQSATVDLFAPRRSLPLPPRVGVSRNSGATRGFASREAPPHEIWSMP